MRVDGGQNVARSGTDAVDRCHSLLIGQPAHSVKEALLVLPIMVQRVVLEAVDDFAASVPNGLFLRPVVGPEEVGRSAVTHNGNEANEIVEASVRNAFDVEIECDAGVRDRRAIQNVNFLIAEGDGLEGVVVPASFTSLAFPTP